MKKMKLEQAKKENAEEMQSRAAAEIEEVKEGNEEAIGEGD